MSTRQAAVAVVKRKKMKRIKQIKVHDGCMFRFMLLSGMKRARGSFALTLDSRRIKWQKNTHIQNVLTISH